MEIGPPTLELAWRPSLHVRPPYKGGQAGRLLHLRRQISRDFHAGANFDNHRHIPSHGSNSLSFSPRGPFRSTGTYVASRAGCVTCFERWIRWPTKPRGVYKGTPIPATAQLLSHDPREGSLRGRAGSRYPDPGGQCEAVEFFACGGGAPYFDGRGDGAGRRRWRESLRHVQNLSPDRRGRKEHGRPGP